MIPKETSDKSLALIREIGIVKFTTFLMVIIIEYHSMIILQGISEETDFTPEGHMIAVLVTINIILMCMMYFAYMFDHIINSIRKALAKGAA